MEKLFTTTIPVPPEMVPEFTAWAERLGMTVKQRKGSNYITVNYSDGVDLYWLGANLYGKIETSSLSQHGPDAVNKARVVRQTFEDAGSEHRGVVGPCKHCGRRISEHKLPEMYCPQIKFLQ